MTEKCSVCGRPGKKLPGGAHKTCGGKVPKKVYVPFQRGAASAEIPRGGPAAEVFHLGKHPPRAGSASIAGTDAFRALEKYWDLPCHWVKEANANLLSDALEKEGGHLVFSDETPPYYVFRDKSALFKEDYKKSVAMVAINSRELYYEMDRRNFSY